MIGLFSYIIVFQLFHDWGIRGKRTLFLLCFGYDSDGHVRVVVRPPILLFYRFEFSPAHTCRCCRINCEWVIRTSLFAESRLGCEFPHYTLPLFRCRWMVISIGSLTALRASVVATDKTRGSHRNPESLRGGKVTSVTPRVIEHLFLLKGILWHG